jgi:dimethylamine monooxygenase subunit A
MNWARLFADSGFRWQMGLRTGDAQAYFAPTAENEEILSERRQLLARDPTEYACLNEAGQDLLDETLAFARECGIRDARDGVSIEQLGGLLEPDFVLLQPGPDGPVVRGGVVCFPSSWSLPEKMGCTLHQTHAPVPELNSQLGERVQAALARLAPGNAWERENWGMSRDGNRNHHPSRPSNRLDATVEPAELWLRVERQILYRLPRTGGLLFGIRLVLVPWNEFVGIPEAISGLRRSLETMPDDIAAYKGLAAAKPKILELMAV